MQILNMAKHLRLVGFLKVGIAPTFLAPTLLAATLLVTANAYAEYIGLPSGRSANIPALPSTSVEAGFVTGDFGANSYQSFGARLNFRPSETLMAYFDIAQVEVEDHDGLGYGIGFFYHVPGITKTSHFAVKVSYHTASLEESGNSFDIDGNALSIEGLLSGQKIGESDLRWYANFGMHKFDVDNGYDDTELGFGGGVFTDTSFGEFFTGFDIIDEMTFGLGVRYHLQ